jgi:hypothetical protein
MGQTAPLVFVGLAGVVVLFQLAMILGAPWGHLTMGGRWPGRLPAQGRIAAGLSALLMGALAAVIAARGGLIAMALPGWAGWAVVGFMGLSVLMHVATPSAAERRLWLPVVVLMLAAALMTVTGGAAPA